MRYLVLANIIQTSDLVIMFLVLFFMLILTYFTTKFIAKSYGMTSGRKTKSFQIIDRIVLGKESSLIIVKVGEKVILLGVTPQNVQKICCLDDDFLEKNTIVESLDQMTFTEALIENLKSKFGKEENKDFDDE